MAESPERRRYEELVKARDEKKQKLMEAKAARASLQAREKEIVDELALLGVANPDDLETIVQREEQEIKQTLDRIEAVLNGTVQVEIPKHQVQLDVATIDVDQLLITGSSS